MHQHSLTAEREAEARAQITELGQFKDTPVAPRTSEQQRAAEEALWAWYLPSSRARRLVPRLPATGCG